MITRAAIKLHSMIYVGKEKERHSDVFRDMIVNRGVIDLKGCVQGFMTEYGLFLNRHDAARHAWDCEQLPNEKICPDCIISEDLW